MKADNTRSTFNRKKHYSSVRMQQGRVQLDADWNEQVDITAHRVETETSDVVGHQGTPFHHAGFHLVANAVDLTEEEKALPENENPPALQSRGDFYISGGYLYLDGILCQNEHIVPFTNQPDSPGLSPLSGSGTYLAYLDVWTRHITSLEDPEIREKALGGVDTATRTKTVWQVKLIKVGNINVKVNCLHSLQAWDDVIAPVTGKFAARAEKAKNEDEPCILKKEAGYRRLENQLYRVEVHQGGKRGTVTFKWSRDNGSIVTKWLEKDGNKLTVSSTVRDKVLNFASGQWIELTDDTHELLGKPGTLVELTKVEGRGDEDVLTINPATATGPIQKANFSNNPKVRRWNSDGEIKPSSSQWIELEYGVQVRFSTGTYKTGDYWLIPARVAGADVEWSRDDTEKPILQLPHGIQHHYCRLALLRFDRTDWIDVSDCRMIFPPVTELTNLFYVGGDGQEAMPGHTLPNALKVRVANGQVPVVNANVQFNVLHGGGTLSINAPVSTVSPDGIAECVWTLGTSGNQQVKAVLLNAAGQPVPGQTVQFNANLSIASNIEYDPNGCRKWADPNKIKTVEDAINRLCMREQKGGCTVTVGVGGQYSTLYDAFKALGNSQEICLCLLPGSHTLEKDLPVDGKNKKSIKITGCGVGASVINQSIEELSFTANHVLLQDICVNITNETGGVVLDANMVTAERCAFKRATAGKDTGPLVLIEPKHRINSCLQWRTNLMEVSQWVEVPSRLWEYFIPEGVVLGIAISKRMKAISQINPHDNKKGFDIAISNVVQDIQKLSRDRRQRWYRAYKRLPETMIKRLPAAQRNALERFFVVLNKASVKFKEMKEKIVDLFDKFRISHNTDALAITSDVRGRVIDNYINGYLSLHYDARAEYLKWGKIDSTQRKDIQTWLAKNFHIADHQMMLRGNNLYMVRSNGFSIMKAIDSIIKGKIPSGLSQVGYKSLVAVGNTFKADSNSFICGSLIMNGNMFTDTSAVVAKAYVVGNSGAFVGNVSSVEGAVIETFPKGAFSDAANHFLEIK